MEIKFYKTTSENNRLDKILTDEKIIQGSCRDSIQVTNPVITIKGYVKDYNYCYIEAFKRYYYVEATTMVGGLTTMVLTVDVLTSFKDKIRLLESLLEKQESSHNNPYWNDGYVVDQRPTMDKIPFQNNFDDGEFILITIKGGEKID